MPQPKSPEYTIIRERQFEDNFSKIVESTDNSRISDIEQVIDWALSKNPSIFPQIGWGEGIYHYYKFEDLGSGFPQVIILFELDETAKSVTLINIREI